MKKKIYYKDKYIEFSEDVTGDPKDPSLKVIRISGSNESGIKQLIEEFLSPDRAVNYLLVTPDIKKTIAKFRTHFKYIEAAGGLIERDDQFLFIFRHGRWDLPKGKLEKNETPEDGAARECEEECGVKDLKIGRKLTSTWHVYEHKGGFALKKTFWYYMTTGYTGPLTPQLDEGISESRWMSSQDIKTEVLHNTYYTIADVVKDALDIGS